MARRERVGRWDKTERRSSGEVNNGHADERSAQTVGETEDWRLDCHSKG